MKLYSLTKRQFVLVFVVFFTCIATCAIIGLAGEFRCKPLNLVFLNCCISCIIRVFVVRKFESLICSIQVLFCCNVEELNIKSLNVAVIN